MSGRATRHTKLKTRRALGLIETLAAMGILVMAVTPLMGMVISAGASRTSNEYMTVAANLAREGIEVVVAKRNNNWINDAAFDAGMYIGSGATSDYTFGLAFDPSTSLWSFVNNPLGGAPSAITDALAKVYVYTSGANAGLMAQGTVAVPQPAGTSVTKYSRLVTLDAICWDGSVESIAQSGFDCGANTKIGVRVTSTVQWPDKGQNHNISAVETIYDWR